LLHFENSSGECVIYEVNAGRLDITRGPDVFPITPDEVIVSNLQFSIIDDLSTAHTVQPRVTIKMEGEMDTSKEEHKQKMILQTTVSSRSYD